MLKVIQECQTVFWPRNRVDLVLNSCYFSSQGRKHAKTRVGVVFSLLMLIGGCTVTQFGVYGAPIPLSQLQITRRPPSGGFWPAMTGFTMWVLFCSLRHGRFSCQQHFPNPKRPCEAYRMLLPVLLEAFSVFWAVPLPKRGQNSFLLAVTCQKHNKQLQCCCFLWLSTCPTPIRTPERLPHLPHNTAPPPIRHKVGCTILYHTPCCSVQGRTTNQRAVVFKGIIMIKSSLS